MGVLRVIVYIIRGEGGDRRGYCMSIYSVIDEVRIGGMMCLWEREVRGG
jgi:hypothetical protein